MMAAVITLRLLWSFFSISWVTAQDKILVTMVTTQPFDAESMDPYPEYYCYLNSPDATVTAMRVWDTRTDRANSLTNNPDPPPPQLIMPHSSYPAGSAVYKVSLSFNMNIQSYAFGTFSCDASKDDRKTTRVSNILVNSNVHSLPADGLVTQTVNEGDTGVEIRMMSHGHDVVGWYRNEERIGTSSRFTASGGTLSINNTVEKSLHEGVYEAITDFQGQPRVQPRHGLKRLIVRSCAANHWGPCGCTGICDNCYNGGVCDDETGRCICPPGFMGTNCLTACGGNRFGYSCEFQCSYDGDNEDACSGLQFCLLDPFGCRCNTGWKGLGCDSACSEGTYGASCLQDCHCDGLCDKFTGVCNGICEAGWSGQSCQIPDVCPSGYYGSNCTDKCYCKNNASCDRMTGACQNSECNPGYMIYAGSHSCQECQGNFFGESCLQECRCSADACNKVTGECSGQCKSQWVDAYQCLAGVESVTSSKINPNTTSDINCVTQIFRNSAEVLTLNLSRETDQIVNHKIQFVNRTMMGDTEVWRFTASDVKDGDELFCLLLLGDDISASLSSTIIEYDLPSLRSPPTLVAATATSISIRWRSWDPDRDYGDPPVVAYIPYYRKAVSEEWISGTAVSSGETLKFMADNLEADTEYSFSVAVVREGVNGEGPRGPSVNLRTKCDVSDIVPQNVLAYLNETAKQVNISWQNPDNVCSSSISAFFIYYKKEGSKQEPQFLIKAEADVMWITVNTQVVGVGKFSFYVTLTIDEESALSQRSEQVVITQQDIEDIPGQPPLAVIFIAIVVIILAMIITCAVLLLLRHRRTKAVDTADKSVEEADYENAGIPNDPEGYSELGNDLNDRQSKRYEELNKKQGTTAEDTSYDPVRSPQTKTKARNTASEYEEVPMTTGLRGSSATQDFRSKSGKNDSAYEVPDNFYENQVHM